ncbi:uncharacterized protein MAL8P1.12-like [Centruroides vittatus]|uniref:uncharacterized protein MAL8P1.12-like n=1 Tax=Centruroides vittatus TaxID=120091 RepID=UPI00350F8BAE
MEISAWKESLVKNKSQVKIPEDILETIRAGLDFSGPNRWEVLDIIPDLDRVCNNLPEPESQLIKSSLSSKIKKYITKEKSKTVIKDKNYYKYKNNISKVQTFLVDNGLEIIKADKSKQVIIVYADWVKNKKCELVEGKQFRQLPIDPKDIIYKELKSRVTRLHKMNKLTKAEKEFILNDQNDRTPKINIQLKTHKDGEQVRPIVDFKYSTLYNLEKFLKQELKSYQNSNFAISNTDELLTDLKDMKIESTFKMASLDIIEMYPSITWDIIEEKLKKLNITPEITQLIEFSYMSNYFEIEGNYYTQNEGISMGSVIGPKLAELVMIDIDEIINKIQGIKFYKRYVDDILIMYNTSEITINQIEVLINNLNKRIQFKTEEEDSINNSINYLDVRITRNRNSIEFEPFKKPCTISTTIKYNSNIPLYIKYNVFAMEYEKIKNRTSKLSNMSKYIKELKNKFVLNGYPNYIITKWEKEINDKTNRNDKQRIEKQGSGIRYISFPYVKGLYEEINKELRKVDIKLAPKYEKLKSRLKNKKSIQQTRTEAKETKNVVYEIPCTCKNKSIYIGETKRKLNIRLKEHVADLRYNRVNSVFHDHCLLNNCNIDQDGTKILYKEKYAYNRKFKESVAIIKSSNSINKNLSININKELVKNIIII